ncbi:MAG: exodeoxyribonuclease V subunit alpha [Acidimicrobiales bacterium]
MRSLTPLLGHDVESLAPFVEAGLLDSSSVHVAGLVARTVGGVETEVLLGAALAARAPRFGHVCVVLETVAETVVVDDTGGAPVGSLPWPDPQHWARLIAESAAVRNVAHEPSAGEVVRPLVWDGDRLYLERYWRFEERVAEELLGRCRSEGALAAPPEEIGGVLSALFGPEEAAETGELDPRQRDAVVRALSRRLAVIAGGPGTGKTLTVSRLLATAYALALAHGKQLEVALAAPTGKAATRMEAAVHEAATALGLRAGVGEALGKTEAKTLHRLLGIGTAGTPRYDRRNRLPHDLVVVDETSMVSLPLMARLLEAVRPEATLVLVGDPFQLASVEAGAVLGEIVGPAAFGRADGPLADGMVMLEHNHRFGPRSEIAAFAEAVRNGEVEGAFDVLGGRRSGELDWVEVGGANTGEAGLGHLRDEAAANAVEVVRAAQAGDSEGALRHAFELKVLCATRFGPLGVSGWTNAIEVGAKKALPDASFGGRRYVGRPIMVTHNDYFNNVFNGDVGLVMEAASGQNAVFLDPSGGQRKLALSQLGEIDTWWATTIHKSQGSEFDKVIVSLPPAPSPILTRELLYTAVTRAKSQVTLVASADALRAAIGNRVARASGLRAKLWPEIDDLARENSRAHRPRAEQAQQLRFEL